MPPTPPSDASRHRDLMQAQARQHQDTLDAFTRLQQTMTDVGAAIREGFADLKPVGTRNLALIVREGEAQLRRSTSADAAVSAKITQRLQDEVVLTPDEVRALGGITLGKLRERLSPQPIFASGGVLPPKPPRQVVVDGVVHSLEQNPGTGTARCTCLWTPSRPRLPGAANLTPYYDSRLAVLAHLDRLEAALARKTYASPRPGPAVAKPREPVNICDCGGHCDPEAVEEFNATEEPKTCDCGEHGNGGCPECNPNLASAAHCYACSPGIGHNAPEPIQGDVDNPPWHSEEDVLGPPSPTVSVTLNEYQLRAVRSGAYAVRLDAEQTAAVRDAR